MFDRIRQSVASRFRCHKCCVLHDFCRRNKLYAGCTGPVDGNYKLDKPKPHISLQDLAELERAKKQILDAIPPEMRQWMGIK